MRGKTPSSNFSWPWRCPLLVKKKVAGTFLAMHREVTSRKSNHEFFSYLTTVMILLGCDIYKNEFFCRLR